MSRKSVLPVFEELNSLLFYPVQYEGEESQRNVFYTGAAPNQQAIPPQLTYLMSEDGGSAKRWVLAGTDYVYPQTTNKILQAYLESKAVAKEDIMINYTPFRAFDWRQDRDRHKELRLGRQEDGGGLDHQRRRQRAVLQGARQPGHQGRGHPCRRLLGGRGRTRRPRHRSARRPSWTAWNYFQSVDTPENAAFIDAWPAPSSRTTSVSTSTTDGSACDRFQHVD